VMACRDIKPISQLREDIDVLILQSWASHTCRNTARHLHACQHGKRIMVPQRAIQGRLRHTQDSRPASWIPFGHG
jgi:hypothetical protein